MKLCLTKSDVFQHPSVPTLLAIEEEMEKFQTVLRRLGIAQQHLITLSESTMQIICKHRLTRELSMLRKIEVPTCAAVFNNALDECIYGTARANKSSRTPQNTPSTTTYD